MKKGDVGMVKRFSKKYGNKGRAFNYLQSESYGKIPDATFLHHCLQNHRQYFTILSWIQALDTRRPKVLFQAFQLHGGIISHMLVLAKPSSTVHKIKYLDTYHWSHISFSCLFLRQWYRDVASGTDKHLDIQASWHNFRTAGIWMLFPCFRTC